MIRSAWLRLLVLDGAWFLVVFGRRCSEVAPKFVSGSGLTRIGVPVARTRHSDCSVAAVDVLIRLTHPRQLAMMPDKGANSLMRDRLSPSK